MAKLLLKNLFIEDAKAVLKQAYEIDRSGTYNNNNLLTGNELSAQITENKEASKLSTRSKFDVEINSSTLNEVTLKEKFEDYLWAVA